MVNLNSIVDLNFKRHEGNAPIAASVLAEGVGVDNGEAVVTIGTLDSMSTDCACTFDMSNGDGDKVELITSVVDGTKTVCEE